jgi:hypothetical protein
VSARDELDPVRVLCTTVETAVGPPLGWLPGRDADQAVIAMMEAVDAFITTLAPVFGALVALVDGDLGGPLAVVPGQLRCAVEATATGKRGCRALGIGSPRARCCSKSPGRWWKRATRMTPDSGGSDAPVAAPVPSRRVLLPWHGDGPNGWGVPQGPSTLGNRGRPAWCYALALRRCGCGPGGGRVREVVSGPPRESCRPSLLWRSAANKLR